MAKECVKKEYTWGQAIVVFLGIMLLIGIMDSSKEEVEPRNKDEKIEYQNKKETTQNTTSSLAVKNGLITKPLVVCLTADLYKDMLKKTLLGDDLGASKYLQRGDCLEFKTGLHITIIGHPEPAIAKVRISDGGSVSTEGYTMYYFVSEE